METSFKGNNAQSFLKKPNSKFEHSLLLLKLVIFNLNCYNKILRLATENQNAPLTVMLSSFFPFGIPHSGSVWTMFNSAHFWVLFSFWNIPSLFCLDHVQFCPILSSFFLLEFPAPVLFRTCSILPNKTASSSMNSFELNHIWRSNYLATQHWPHEAYLWSKINQPHLGINVLTIYWRLLRFGNTSNQYKKNVFV